MDWVMKDLEFIRSVVSHWPDSAKFVRLDKDGEICFMGCGTQHDFRPANVKSAKAAFCRAEFHVATGNHYTKEEWQGAKQ